MKLKFELVNGYGVLVDEEEEIIAGDLILWNGKVKTAIDTEYIHPSHKIIFAEPELKLEGVPVFEWRDFEVWQKSKEVKHWGQFASTAFVKGYKSNPAKYTEGDLKKILEEWGERVRYDNEGYTCSFEKWWSQKRSHIIQSLQKYPKWVVMESEIISLLPTGNHTIKKEDVSKTFKTDFKLFTNSEGKKQGTIEELIWT